MFSYRHLKPLMLGLAVLAGGASSAMAAPLQTGTAISNAAILNRAPARVWFLRPASGPDGHEWGAAPTVYANGASLGAIQPNTKFYRDFSPGTYSFTVDPYGVDNLPNTVALAPDSETYLAVEWVPTWEEGIPGGGRGSQGNAFFVLTMPSQLGRAYLQALSYPNQG
jgi:hypothetical protein